MSFKAVFESTRANLRDGRATNPIHVKARSENQGGFRSIVKMRDFTLTVDQPKGFGGTNTGPKPSEVLLAALAACQEVTWRLYADNNNDWFMTGTRAIWARGAWVLSLTNEYKQGLAPLRCPKATRLLAMRA